MLWLFSALRIFSVKACLINRYFFVKVHYVFYIIMYIISIIDDLEANLLSNRHGLIIVTGAYIVSLMKKVR